MWHLGGGHRKKKTALKGGHLKKIREKGGSRKILPLLEGGSWEKNLVTGGVMQLSNDTSKNSTRSPYLVKNERSLTFLHTHKHTHTGEDPGNEVVANFASGRMTNHRSVVKRKIFCLDIVSRRVINNYSSSPNGL